MRNQELITRVRLLVQDFATVENIIFQNTRLIKSFFPYIDRLIQGNS